MEKGGPGKHCESAAVAGKDFEEEQDFGAGVGVLPEPDRKRRGVRQDGRGDGGDEDLAEGNPAQRVRQDEVERLGGGQEGLRNLRDQDPEHGLAADERHPEVGPRLRPAGLREGGPVHLRAGLRPLPRARRRLPGGRLLELGPRLLQVPDHLPRLARGRAQVQELPLHEELFAELLDHRARERHPDVPVHGRLGPDRLPRQQVQPRGRRLRLRKQHRARQDRLRIDSLERCRHR